MLTPAPSRRMAADAASSSSLRRWARFAMRAVSSWRGRRGVIVTYSNPRGIGTQGSIPVCEYGHNRSRNPSRTGHTLQSAPPIGGTTVDTAQLAAIAGHNRVTRSFAFLDLCGFTDFGDARGD